MERGGLCRKEGEGKRRTREERKAGEEVDGQCGRRSQAAFIVHRHLIKW